MSSCRYGSVDDDQFYHLSLLIASISSPTLLLSLSMDTFLIENAPPTPRLQLPQDDEVRVSRAGLHFQWLSFVHEVKIGGISSLHTPSYLVLHYMECSQ